jgi:hypothetical protein
MVSGNGPYQKRLKCRENKKVYSVGWVCHESDDFMEWGPYCGKTREEWALIPDRVKGMVAAHANEVWITFFDRPGISSNIYGCRDPVHLAFETHSQKDQDDFTEIVSKYLAYMSDEHQKEVAAEIVDKPYFQEAEVKIEELKTQINALRKKNGLRRQLE